jgi:hypothetical protein
VKRLLILLVVLAAALAAASLAVPNNAATVNGVAITQDQLNSDISAIASGNGGLYACFLNAEQLVATQGQSGLPPLKGAGVAAGAHATATTAFISTYLDTDIGHELVLQVAHQHHLVITPSDIASARTELEAQVTSVMEDVSGSQYACSGSTQTLTGAQVLGTMPKPFVSHLVQFDATISVLEEYLSGVGSSLTDLEHFYAANHAQFDTACFTVAQYSTMADAQAAITKVHAGTPFATVAAQEPGGGPQGCDILYGIVSELPAANLQTLKLNTLSAPISESGTYLVVEITSRTPTPFPTAESEVRSAIRSLGSVKTQSVIGAEERRAAVSVDPRYGTWNPDESHIAVPAVPAVGDVLNAAVDATAATPATTPATGQSG